MNKHYGIRQSLIWVLCSLVVFGCKKAQEKVKKEDAFQNSPTQAGGDTSEIPFPIYDFNAFEELLKQEDDYTYIVNFWATWCKPCIEEMPHFERTYMEQRSNKVKLLLVSLDMPSMWQKRLVPFVKQKKLQGEVVILDDPKMNEWIPKVDEDWQGGIPATLIYNKEKRRFFERGFTYEELNTELGKFLNKQS